MLRILGASLLLGSALAFCANSALAFELVETKVQKNPNGTFTYHFAVKTGQGETMTPGEDFVTVYNFNVVRGAAKLPAGWTASSQIFGKTPTFHGYPAVLPVDVPDLSNVTWTPMSPISAGSTVDGFSATTRMGGTTTGEYSAQVTQDEPAADGGQSKASKQAIIGQINTPRFVP
jgi:hypothetical protein